MALEHALVRCLNMFTFLYMYDCPAVHVYNIVFVMYIWIPNVLYIYTCINSGPLEN